MHPGDLEVPVWWPDNQSIICSLGNAQGSSQDTSIVEVSVADGTSRQLCPERFFHITKMAWLPRKAGLMLCARKHIGGKNELWRMSYPGMEISLINEGLSSYVDLSIALDGETAVASQATRISDVWVGPSAEPRVLKKITQATDTFCWTPEGRLVYLSTAGGNSDLWIMRA